MCRRCSPGISGCHENLMSETSLHLEKGGGGMEGGKGEGGRERELELEKFILQGL